jgi:hypothetical protein
MFTTKRSSDGLFSEGTGSVLDGVRFFLKTIEIGNRGDHNFVGEYNNAE